MKAVTTAYIAKEEAIKRKPVELYKIWTGATYWYYTNGDISVVYDGHTYDPAVIKRGEVGYNANFEINTLNIQIAPLTEPAIQYIAQNPVDVTWVEVSRLFRDQDPLEKSVVFIGQIKSVSFKGLIAEVMCVGFEHFLKMPIPVRRYQPTCNHKIFDSGCKKTKSSYKVTATITLDATKTILTSSTFADHVSEYFTLGLVEHGEEYRTIIGHNLNTITIQYKMRYLEDNESVDVYPGCNGKIETCRDTYDNIINFFGFPFIPKENPSLRVP